MAEARARIVPHQTRVVVPGRGPGMVIGVQHAVRHLLGIGLRVPVAARVLVVLDAGGRIEWPTADVAIELPKVGAGGSSPTEGVATNSSGLMAPAGTDDLGDAA